MKTFTNVFLLGALALIIGLSGCSKQAVEPDPADQVIGTYNGTAYSESTNGVAQTIDLTNALIKNDLMISMDVAKKSVSTIAIVLHISQRDSTGNMQTATDSYDTIDLKSLGNGDFDMLNAGVSVGQIGNGILKLQETYTDTDASGKGIQVTVSITSKKS